MISPADPMAPQGYEAAPLAASAGDDAELSEDIDLSYEQDDPDPDPDIDPRWLDKLRPRGVRSRDFEEEL